jgi:L-amino acid N-acyltransferase YncA
LRIRTAILAAYQDAVKMREVGFNEEPPTILDPSLQ